MNRTFLIIIGLTAAVTVGGGIIGARTLMKPKFEPEQSETVSRGDVEISVAETGTIESLRKVEVKSKVGGRISKLSVDAGQSVSAGQVLATIDSKEINSQVAALQAQLSGAKARLEAARTSAAYQAAQTINGIAQYEHAVQAAKARLLQAEAEASVQPQLTAHSIEGAAAGLDSAKAQVKAQRDNLNLMVRSTHTQAVVNAQSAYDQAVAQAENAAKHMRRQQNLLAKGFVSQQVVDTASTDYEVATAHEREVKERLDRIKLTNELEEENLRSQITSGQSVARQMQSSLEQAKSTVAPTIKRREVDGARAAYEQALSQLASARAAKLQDKIRLDEVSSSEAEVRQIQNNLNVQLVSQADTTIVASMAGVITKRYVEEAELITSAIGSFSSGSPMFQLSDLASMRVKININEVDAAKVKPGLLTEVTIDSAKGAKFMGRVSKVAPAAADASQTGNNGGQAVIRFPVEIRVDHADPRLKPGMSAHCSIIVARKKNVLRVPGTCIQWKGGKPSVRIVTTAKKDGQTVETTTPRDVTLGMAADDAVEIISGVREGEKLRPNIYTGPPRPTIDFKGEKG